jgi:Tfp pilus assembly protein PilX
VKRTRQNGIALVTAMLIMILISSLIIGFSWLVLSDQNMGGSTGQRQTAFYAAEAGMEQLTASLNNLFAQNYAPTDAQINALFAVGQDPSLSATTQNVMQSVSFIDPTKGTPGSGYNISYTSTNGKTPDATTHQITAGAYQGLTGLITPYTLNVIAQANGGGEVKLQRTVQTVGIPLFEFGIFSQTDLSFYAGPPFSFGGRVHTNGNLYLAEGNGNTLTLGDKVTAVGEVIRTNLSNGWNTNTNYTGTVDVLTAPGSFRALATTEGSLVGTLGTGANPGWQNISIGTYHSYIRDGDLDPPLYNGANSTGATTLNLEVATPAIGGTPIDLIRRPIKGELAATPAKLGERYFATASLRILLSDNPADITQLDCVSPTPPIDLSLMAQAPGVNGATWTAAGLAAVVAAANASGTKLIPLAASGGSTGAHAAYSPNDGYWVPGGTPIVTGYIKIDAQTTYGDPCGTYKDVTAEILGLGYVGQNMYPQGKLPVSTPNSYATYGSALLPAFPNNQTQIGTATGPSCTSPHPNAVIRLVRVRDNPSTGLNDDCGTINPQNLAPTDIWPNALFDPREGNARDWCPDGSTGAAGGCDVTNDGTPANAGPTLGGVMYYVELDVNNLTRWFQGTIGQSGAATKDPNIAPNDFSVYFSDRRGNFYSGAAFAGGWPPLSPSLHETGEYGWNDNVNPASQYGCPNNALDAGEDFDQDGLLYTYGAQPGSQPYALAPGVYSPGAVPGPLYTAISAYGAFNTAIVHHVKCPVNPPYISTPIQVWPWWHVVRPQEARENPPLFFRRALKLVNGSTINLGLCPNGVNCGLTIAAENPLYVDGNYNAPGGAFGGSCVGAAAVIADAFTFLTNEWDDANSFWSTYDLNGRQGNTTNFRLAIASGKGVSFQQPGAYGTYQDFGTDGGVHNFLRFVEGLGNATLNYRGSIVSLYYSRQATGVYKDGTSNTVYSPPTRGYNFDTDFLTPACLPPKTPMFRTVNTIGFTEYVLPSIQ